MSYLKAKRVSRGEAMRFARSGANDSGKSWYVYYDSSEKEYCPTSEKIEDSWFHFVAEITPKKGKKRG